ncbi:hypothetical protein B0O99DRAFT_678313 [Bisporella sp. PMI_857]|nr:hypothetical protein B0O99DRAFT_678313 [Bisporella sp. PMI_857]
MKSCTTLLLLCGAFQYTFAIEINDVKEDIARRQVPNSLSPNNREPSPVTVTSTITVSATNVNPPAISQAIPQAGVPANPAANPAAGPVGLPVTTVTVTTFTTIGAQAGPNQPLQTPGVAPPQPANPAGSPPGVAPPQPANPAGIPVTTITITTFTTLGGGAGSNQSPQTAGIIGSARPAGAGAVGIPQPPSAVAPAINSATLALDGIINGAPGVSPPTGGVATGGLANPPAGQATGAGSFFPTTLFHTAGIIASARPAGAGAVGIPQPPSAVAPVINSATLALDGLINGTPGAFSPGTKPTGAPAIPVGGIAPPGVAAPTGVQPTNLPAGVNVATLKVAGILLSAQPDSAATLGIPQPPAPNGTPAPINSATLRTAKIVGGNAEAVVTGTPSNSTTTPVNGGRSLAVGRVVQGCSLLGSLIAFLV